MPPELKPVLARQMEVYAGFLEYADYHFGRLIDALERLEVLENTIVFYLLGDNGASAESTVYGCFNELPVLINGLRELETPEFLASKIDEFGGPNAYNQYPIGWAHAMCTPYQYTKQVASHWGGTRNGLVVHWPAGIAARGELRHQFHHVIDIAPTLLEVTGIPEPAFVNGIQQSPIEGTSMRYSFDRADAPETHETQYFEMVCNRGIYHKGWSAVTKHRAPWEPLPPPPLDADEWELYAPDDWTQSRNIVHENPEMLARLRGLWLMEAATYNVLPLDDRLVERNIPTVAGRPRLVPGTSQFLFGDMGRLSEASTISIKNRSHSLAADLDVRSSPVRGVIAAQGGRFGGWSLYVKEGRPVYFYNYFGIEHYVVEGDRCSPKAITNSGSCSNTTAVARGRAASPRSSSTASRLARAESNAPSRSGSPSTKRWISGAIPVRRFRPTTVPAATASAARSTGFASISSARLQRPRVGGRALRRLNGL